MPVSKRAEIRIFSGGLRNYYLTVSINNDNAEDYSIVLYFFCVRGVHQHLEEPSHFTKASEEERIKWLSPAVTLEICACASR